MIPSWLYISQTAGTSGTTVITLSAGTNSLSNYIMDSFEVENNSNLTVTVTVIQRASGDCDYSKCYFSIECLSKGHIYWSNQYIQRDFYYRKNNGNWIQGYKSTAFYTFNVEKGDILEFKSTMEPVLVAGAISNEIYVLDSDILYKAKGNILSLILGDNFLDNVNYPSYYYAYYDFFAGSSGLIDASDLIFPSKSPSNYTGMFKECLKLKKAPDLPATEVIADNYYAMFMNCLELEKAPALPATTLAYRCYYYMFAGCTSLTNVPDLPATTLAPMCYAYMYYGCTGLYTPSKIQARTLASGCCTYMFAECTNINTAYTIYASTLESTCYMGMYYNCKNLTQAPILPANNLVDGCYNYMFYGCSSLNYINCRIRNQEQINYGTGLSNWVNGVASTGTFVKPSGITWPTGNNGVPNNWTIEEG